jgi:hypothetical protein
MSRWLLIVLGLASVLLGTPLGLRGLSQQRPDGPAVSSPASRADLASEPTPDDPCCCAAHPPQGSTAESCPCGDDPAPGPRDRVPCRSTCPCAPTPSRGDRTAPPTPLVDYAAARAREGTGRSSVRAGQEGGCGDRWPGPASTARWAEPERGRARRTGEILRAQRARPGVADRSVLSVWTT